MPTNNKTSKVPPDITSMTSKGKIELPLRTSAQPEPKMTNEASLKGLDESSAQDQDTGSSEEAAPGTPARYAALLRVLHHALLAIATIPEPQLASDPALTYLAILSSQNLSDLNKILAEDDQTDWLAQNAKRTQVLISFIGLHREMAYGKFPDGHALQTAKAELADWHLEVKGFAHGEWDPDRKGKELGEIVGKVKAMNRAGKEKERKKVALVPGEHDPLPGSEPQTWQHKQNAIAASKRLQKVMFGDSPVTPMKGKIDFGPPIRKTL